MTLSPKLTRAISRPLPHAAMGISFVTGQPSLALPDTDGRHDRSGHGTWVLLAVFVVHVCRPWLSVTGYGAARLTPASAEMDPRACDGQTTVCPLWLFTGRIIFSENRFPLFGIVCRAALRLVIPDPITRSRKLGQ